MKTFEQFEKDWLNKGFQENSNLGFQCVAGAKIFSKEVFGVNLSGFDGTAFNGFVNGNPIKGLDFTKIEYKNGMVFKEGDIIFFGKNKQNGYCGHVGIVKSATDKQIVVLNQNMGTGTGKAKSDTFKLSVFDYSNVMGVFRYNKYFKEEQMGDYEKMFKDKYGKGTIFDNIDGGLKKCIDKDGNLNSKEFFYFVMIGLERLNK